ncbi:MAG: hypothetical protein SR1Q7_02605 [Quinella sp. 1Q7]|nr:hypothetical protein [Quinella sp. 1Q7]
MSARDENPNKLNAELERMSDDHDAEIADAWAALGVTAVIHSGTFFTSGSENEYYIGTKRITQLEARHYAMNVVGKQMKYSDWHW